MCEEGEDEEESAKIIDDLVNCVDADGNGK